MAAHSTVLAWRIPGTGEPGGLPSMGSHRVRYDWSDLAAAAARSWGLRVQHFWRAIIQPITVVEKLSNMGSLPSWKKDIGWNSLPRSLHLHSFMWTLSLRPSWLSPTTSNIPLCLPTLLFFLLVFIPTWLVTYSIFTVFSRWNESSGREQGLHLFVYSVSKTSLSLIRFTSEWMDWMNIAEVPREPK